MDQNASATQTVQKPAPQPSPSNPPPAPSTPSPKRFSKKMLIIIGIVLVVIIGIVVFFLQRGGSNNFRSLLPQIPDPINQNVNSPTSEFTLQDGTTISTEDVARDSARFTEDLRQTDGSYEYLYNFKEYCTDKNECPFGTDEFNMRVNGWTALGYFGMSKISNREESLQKANRDLQNLYTWCNGRENECLWMLVQPALIYEETQDEAAKNFVVENATRLSSQPLAENEMIAGIEVRELALAYKLSGNVGFLNSANQRLTHALNILKNGSNIYSDKENSFFSQYTCWTTLGMIELDDAQNTTQNIANAIAFLSAAKISENIEYFIFPSEIQPCIESYYLLGDATGDEKFYKDANEIMESFISHFFNNSNNGKGGTYFYNISSDPFIEKKYMIASDASYTNYLLGLYHTHGQN